MVRFPPTPRHLTRCSTSNRRDTPKAVRSPYGVTLRDTNDRGEPVTPTACKNHRSGGARLRLGAIPRRHRTRGFKDTLARPSVTILRRILQIIGWGIFGLLVLPFLIGYAAPYLPPAHFWWTDLFAVVLPPLALVVGLLGLGLLWTGVHRGAWWRVVVAGTLLVLITVRFAPRISAGGASASTAETLRVMTFNVPMSFARQNASARALGRFVGQEGPDVAAFQESWVSTGPSARVGVEGRSWPPGMFLEDSLGYAPPRILPPQTIICQPVFGRLPLDSMSVHSVRPTGDDHRCARYTRTQFTWQGRSAILYNLHLHTIGSIRPWDVVGAVDSLGYWRAFLREYREGALRRAEEARRIGRRIAQETKPVLVVGDFNSTPHQWAYQHLAHGLQSAGSGEATFPARQPIVRIDHILAGPEWDVVSGHVPVPREETTISDHRPVVARLQWKNGYEE